MNIIELSDGKLRLGVLPELGGALAWMCLGDFDLLRRWDGTRNVRHAACYPLVPYSNRIENGRFCCGSAHYQLPRNFGEHPHSIHGLGWQREWEIIERSGSACRLRLTHDPKQPAGDHWPFAFEAEQSIRLDGHGVSLSLKLRNESEHHMPAGLGWHPYFPRHRDIELAFEATSVWTKGADSLPLESIKIPERWDFSSLRGLGYVGLDNCFKGWKRRAELYWSQADIGLVMSANEGLDYLVIFTPSEPKDFIAVEPVSHMNNAINMPSPLDNGIVLLAPGQSMERSFNMYVKAKIFTEAT